MLQFNLSHYQYFKTVLEIVKLEKSLKSDVRDSYNILNIHVKIYSKM